MKKVTFICIAVAALHLTSCINEISDPNAEILKASVMCAPSLTDLSWYESDNIAPLFEGLSGIQMKITCKDSLVQRYFNQGMMLAYGFNHAEAARSFYYASKLDPECAMCYWGYAYVLGPNYNLGMEPDNYQRAFEAIVKAKSLSIKTSQKEKDLIAAMLTRYVKDPIDDRSALDLAYSDALKSLTDKYPNDPDIYAIYAESQMNLHPWDLYEKTGNPKPWTPSIIAALEMGLSLFPDHPGAHHLYIHAVEASNTPERGLASADKLLAGLVSGSGHLVHMPSHIYIRTGDYHKGSIANIEALKVDSTYIEACHAQGAYPIAYYPHNYHFLTATATLEGDSKTAIESALVMSKKMHPEIMRTPGFGTIQHYYTIPYYVYIKFGKWDEILSLSNFDSSIVYPEAIRNYARGLAFVAKNDLTSAEQSLQKLDKLSEDEDLQELRFWEINSASDILSIASKVLKAEILAAEKKYDAAISVFQEAILIEDALNYQEPPDWFFSVRHNLAAIQIDAKKYEDAIETLNEDLAKLPNNGWALKGLSTAYKALNKKEELMKTNALLKEAWAHADVKIKSSRIL